MIHNEKGVDFEYLGYYIHIQVDRAAPFLVLGEKMATVDSDGGGRMLTVSLTLAATIVPSIIVVAYFTVDPSWLSRRRRERAANQTSYLSRR